MITAHIYVDKVVQVTVGADTATQADWAARFHLKRAPLFPYDKDVTVLYEFPIDEHIDKPVDVHYWDCREKESREEKEEAAWKEWKAKHHL
jgi:hypothetical protein